MNIELRPLDKSEEEIFVRENQAAFDKAAIEEFGPQEESVIPREDIISSIHAENAQAFRIIVDGEPVGGVVVDIHPDTQRNELNLLYINPDCHSRGSGKPFGGWSRRNIRKRKSGRRTRLILKSAISTSM